MENLRAEGNEPERLRALNDEDATVPVDELVPPSRDGAPEVPGYRVLRRIGAGIASTVYLALELRSQEGLALKVLEPGMRDEGWVRRFLAESEKAGRLAAPCVARVLDRGERGGWFYVAMEYLAGGNLRDRIGPALAPAEALRYLLEAAGALEYLHGAGVVHRNLKPQNILFRASGTLVLSDFGLENAGSGRYASPECARGEPLDPRHDLYSLGVIAYEMLSGGRALFEGETAAAVMGRHLSAPPPPLPVGLLRFQPVLDRLLAKTPAERYPGAPELISDLKARFADVLAG